MLKFAKNIKFFKPNGLAFRKPVCFSETINSKKETSSQEVTEFNSYKTFADEVRKSQNTTDKETNWKRLDDKEALQLRKQIRDKRKENVMAIYVAIIYMLYEDEYGRVRGVVIGPFDFSFLDRFFKKKETDQSVTNQQAST